MSTGGSGGFLTFGSHRALRPHVGEGAGLGMGGQLFGGELQLLRLSGSLPYQIVGWLEMPAGNADSPVAVAATLNRGSFGCSRAKTYSYEIAAIKLATSAVYSPESSAENRNATPKKTEQHTTHKMLKWSATRTG